MASVDAAQALILVARIAVDSSGDFAGAFFNVSSRFFAALPIATATFWRVLALLATDWRSFSILAFVST